jgi:hypothetical protein
MRPIELSGVITRVEMFSVEVGSGVDHQLGQRSFTLKVELGPPEATELRVGMPVQLTTRFDALPRINGYHARLAFLLVDVDANGCREAQRPAGPGSGVEPGAAAARGIREKLLWRDYTLRRCDQPCWIDSS